MRFLADMGIALDVVLALREQGHDVFHLTERSLQRLPDADIVDLAAAERRVVLTHDLDFGRLLFLRASNEPSIITFRLSDMTPPSVLKRTQEAIRLFESELADGAAVTISDMATRCHHLPISTQDQET